MLFYMPPNYAIDSEKITMNKYFGNIVILRNDTKSISKIKSKGSFGLDRKFSSGGYYGKFNFNDFKDIYIYSGSLSSNLFKPMHRNLISMNWTRDYF